MQCVGVDFIKTQATFLQHTLQETLGLRFKDYSRTVESIKSSNQNRNRKRGKNKRWFEQVEEDLLPELKRKQRLRRNRTADDKNELLMAYNRHRNKIHKVFKNSNKTV